MTPILSWPEGLNAATFLAEYWQKKPLLIRAAFADFENPLSAEELAGMACEDGIEARLIVEKDGPVPWWLRHGPFSTEQFVDLPASHWTVLVQEVHKYVPSLAQLLDAVRFIPSWRIDDIMASYAPVHGSAGPHVDNYDVFLLQGAGRKRWRISDQKVAPGDLIPDLELSIVAEFELQQEWVLAPGDMLYLPPGIIHHGVALDDNITYSIGFRAPSERDLAVSFVGYQAEYYLSARHYGDPDLSAQLHPGEISADAIQRVRSIIEQLPVNDRAIARWFGEFVTESKSGDEVEPRDEPVGVGRLIARLAAGEDLWRSEFSRFACIEEGDRILLFVAGQHQELPRTLAACVHRLCDHRRLTFVDWRSLLEHQACTALVCELYNEGHLYFENDHG